jgi:hypothetical protein
MRRMGKDGDKTYREYTKNLLADRFTSRRNQVGINRAAGVLPGCQEIG